MGHSLQSWTQWSLWVLSHSEYPLILWNVIDPIRKPRLTFEEDTWEVWQAGEACKASAYCSRRFGCFVKMGRGMSSPSAQAGETLGIGHNKWSCAWTGVFQLGSQGTPALTGLGRDLLKDQCGTAWDVPFTGCFRKINSHLVCWKQLIPLQLAQEGIYFYSKQDTKRFCMSRGLFWNSVSDKAIQQMKGKSSSSYLNFPSLFIDLQNTAI